MVLGGKRSGLAGWENISTVHELQTGHKIVCLMDELKDQLGFWWQRGQH